MTLDAHKYPVCVVTDRRISGGRSHEEIAREAIAGGVRFIQFRDKEMGTRELLEAATELRRITRDAGALLVVNDRPDIALAAEADGVHVGQEDMPVRNARALLGARAIVGATARTPDQAVEAAQDGASYVGVGPVYEARGSKPDTLAPQGPGLLRRVRERATLPMLAIGGIGPGNARDVILAGADGVAVISSVVAADDIAAAAARLVDVVNKSLEERERS